MCSSFFPFFVQLSWRRSPSCTLCGRPRPTVIFPDRFCRRSRADEKEFSNGRDGASMAPRFSLVFNALLLRPVHLFCVVGAVFFLAVPWILRIVTIRLQRWTIYQALFPPSSSLLRPTQFPRRFLFPIDGLTFLVLRGLWRRRETMIVSGDPASALSVPLRFFLILLLKAQNQTPISKS